MIFELSGAVEFAATALTLKLTIFVVTANMVFKVTLCDELLIANLTLVIAVSKVALQVNIKVSLLSKLVSTIRAFVWLDPKVLTDMNL